MSIDSPEASSQLFANIPGTAGRKRLEFFDRTAMPEVEIENGEQYCEYPENVPESADLHAFHDGLCAVQTLYADHEENGLSLGCYYFPPNIEFPRHWHDCDQIVVVVEGSVSLGRTVLKPGAGYYTKAGTTYTFKVGPAGVRILEFRAVSNFRTVFVEDKPEKYVKP
ncbi:hypothetical protein GCM10010191_11150 [Actinomadura vinacea]|uniref:Cupin domain-containing protein n=1 Tax=Actinomadura vinacea TaxID=115336 RepID=A0ABP5VJV9_9ACTN